jgi:hypothetical protein
MFTAFYWDVDTLGDEDRAALEAGDYRTLLHSADVRARGVALDQFVYAEAQGRWGLVNPMAGFGAEILDRARALLAVEADPAVPLEAQPQVTAGWNSALGAMAFLPGDGAEEGAADLPRIVEVLRTAGERDLLDDTYAFWAVEVRLVEADPQTCAWVGAWLVATAADPRLPTGVRVAAVRACGDDRYRDRLGGRDAMRALLHDPQLRVSVEAARNLPGDDEVRRVVAGWPQDAPYPAEEVRQAIADADALAAARRTLDFEVLAELGDATDLPALLAALEAGRAGEHYGDAVRRCLRGADDDLVRAAGARLAAVVAGGRVEAAVRVAAMQPYWRRSHLPRPVAVLVGLLGHEDVRLSTAAAHALGGVAHAEVPVRRAAARWPHDAPHPADAVRETLADLDALAAARDLVAAATGPAPAVAAAELTAAAHRILNDGDDGIDGPALLALIGGDGLAEVLRAADPEQAGALAHKLRNALRWRLADGAADPRFAPAAGRLKELAPSMP